MNLKKKNSLLVLTECSIMVALSTVLSIVKIFELPYGGSITLASMLPIVIIAYRHGFKVGVCSSLTASLIQMLLGLNNITIFTTWQSALAVALLDYVIAFSVFGLAGMFRKVIKEQGVSMAIGALIASVCRYICHVISGATIWAGLSIPTEAALIYSISYNATYMIPESVILILTALYIGTSLDFSKQIPERKRAKKLDTVSSYCFIVAGLTVLGALIADTVLIFSKLQNYESGELFADGLMDVNWLALTIVTATCAIIATALVLYAKSRAKKQFNH